MTISQAHSQFPWLKAGFAAWPTDGTSIGMQTQFYDHPALDPLRLVHYRSS